MQPDRPALIQISSISCRSKLQRSCPPGRAHADRVLHRHAVRADAEEDVEGAAVGDAREKQVRLEERLEEALVRDAVLDVATVVDVEEELRQ